MWNASRFCVSSLRRGHANLLCIVPILVYVLPKQVHQGEHKKLNIKECQSTINQLMLGEVENIFFGFESLHYVYQKVDLDSSWAIVEIIQVQANNISTQPVCKFVYRIEISHNHLSRYVSC